MTSVLTLTYPEGGTFTYEVNKSFIRGIVVIIIHREIDRQMFFNKNGKWPWWGKSQND